MNKKSLKTLEYDKIISQLAEYASSPLGAGLYDKIISPPEKAMFKRGVI